MSFFRTQQRIQEEYERARYATIEMEERVLGLERELEVKDEIIRNLRFKQKQLEKRIERMLFELRVSDEVLTIATEKRHEECK